MDAAVFFERDDQIMFYLILLFGMAGAYFGAYFFVKSVVSESPRKVNFLLVMLGFIFGLIASISVMIGLNVFSLNAIGNPNLPGGCSRN